MLSDVVDRKQALLNNKTVNKNGYFPKGLTHGFNQKFQNFCSYFFSKAGLEIMLSCGLEGKEAFQDKKCQFCKV